MNKAPDRSEAAEYYFTYIDKVPAGDIRSILERQAEELPALFEGISEDQSLERYAPDKWSIREVLNHINDAERVFVFRAVWFARGYDAPLPSFDQNTAIASAGADARALSSHIAEFRSIRAATLTFFNSLADEVWDRRGIASGYSFTVRALAYIASGHATHHALILKERYLQVAAAGR